MINRRQSIACLEIPRSLTECNIIEPLNQILGDQFIRYGLGNDDVNKVDIFTITQSLIYLNRSNLLLDDDAFKTIPYILHTKLSTRYF